MQKKNRKNFLSIFFFEFWSAIDKKLVFYLFLLFSKIQMIYQINTINNKNKINSILVFNFEKND